MLPEPKGIPLVINFSDSIVRVVPTKNLFDAGFSVIREIETLSNIQESLLQEGILFRGGLTFGDIYVDIANNILFGPALIKAYSLESTFARVPRIIVDPETKEHFATGSSMLFLMKSKQLQLDDEGNTYIDYFDSSALAQLRQAVKNTDKNELCSELADDLLSQYLNQKKVLEVKLEEAKMNEKVLSKVLWVAMQHNRAAKGLVNIIADGKITTDRKRIHLSDYKVDVANYTNTLSPE